MDDVVKSVKDVVHTRSCENRAVDCTVLSVQHSIAIQDESESSTVVLEYKSTDPWVRRVTSERSRQPRVSVRWVTISSVQTLTQNYFKLKWRSPKYRTFSQTRDHDRGGDSAGSGRSDVRVVTTLSGKNLPLPVIFIAL